MRIVVTGQVGTDKKSFLQRAAAIAQADGFDVTLCNIGDMMYAEAPDIPPGRILDMPLSRLTSLRRGVFKDVLQLCQTKPNVIVNTHATFRWRHGLFQAFDVDLIRALDADLYIMVTDNIDCMHARLVGDGHTDHTLKDLMVWREEEALATELMAQIVRGHGRCYTHARGADDTTAHALSRLMFRPEQKKAYLSFPMTHVANLPKTLAEIDAFRRQLKAFFVCFDPGDLEEKYLTDVALNAVREGRPSVAIGHGEFATTVPTAELAAIVSDIDSQIYTRDFKLIDQSDMIISLIPELPDGRPGLSSGVERELQHAHESARDVFVIWTPACAPSPFITETATRVFTSVAEATEFFVSSGYAAAPVPGSLFDQG